MTYLSTYFRIIALRFLGATQYKADFLIGVLGLFIQQSVVVLVLITIFTGVDQLAGFSLADVLFILGLAQIIRGLDLAYNDYIWVEAFNGFVQGSLYQYMTRPLPIYLQILSNRLNIQSFGPIGIGITLISLSLPTLNVHLNGFDALVFSWFVVLGLMTMFAIKAMAATLALWLGRSGELMQVIHEFVEFVRYPISIYALPLQVVLMIVVPFAMISFIPALYWLPHIALPFPAWFLPEFSRNERLLSFATAVGLGSFITAQLFWRAGLKHATTSGT